MTKCLLINPSYKASYGSSKVSIIDPIFPTVALLSLAAMAIRHREFKEIYHPVTGEPYGGLQIDKGEMRVWASEPNQTWSATGYLRMIHMGLLGLQIDAEANTRAPGCISAPGSANHS